MVHFAQEMDEIKNPDLYVLYERSLEKCTYRCEPGVSMSTVHSLGLQCFTATCLEFVTLPGYTNKCEVMAFHLLRRGHSSYP